MRLINVQTFKFEEFLDERRLPPYAILSHTWGANEVQYLHLLKHEKFRNEEELSFAKVDFICGQALRDRLAYAWVDTCCIDKRSSAELTEAINSMYRWYLKSTVCYVYMSDVNRSHPDTGVREDTVGNVNLMLGLNGEHERKATKSIHGTQISHACENESSQEDTSTAFKKSRWFTRGWTLQELLAPKLLAFYDCHHCFLGTQHDLFQDIQSVTGIPADVLSHETPLSTCSIAMRMSWASERKTTRLEDEAYCLLGIFDVNMPLLYGEGGKAFLRLQEEIMRQSTDQSILAYTGDRSNILAPSPASFTTSATVVPAEYSAKDKSFEMTNRGLSIRLRLWDCEIDSFAQQFALLDCLDTSKPECHLGLPLTLDSRIGEGSTRIEIVLGFEPEFHDDSLIRIPFDGMFDSSRHLSVVEIPALAKRREVMIGSDTKWPAKRDFAPNFTVQVHLDASAKGLACHFYPDHAWEHETLRTRLTKDPKMIILTVNSGVTYVLQLRTSSNRPRLDLENAGPLFFYRLKVCEKQPTESELDDLRWKCRLGTYHESEHRLEDADVMRTRISWEKQLAITIQPSSANKRNSIISIEMQPANGWELYGATRRWMKQVCYWITAPLWFALFLADDVRQNLKYRPSLKRLMWLPVLVGHLDRLNDWVQK